MDRQLQQTHSWLLSEAFGASRYTYGLVAARQERWRQVYGAS